LARASGAVDYNVLQNNGRAAHQEVDHVHFHMIPKPVGAKGEGSKEEGLGVGWPAKRTDMDGLKRLLEEMKAKM
jgi:diadenosine tetraphosphate (Ap4A) HIT family hydrolase